MARLARAAVLATLAALGMAAHADAAANESGMPAFPAATDEGAAMIWLKNNTDLGVGRFVAFGPDNVLVVLTDEVSPRSSSIHRVSFRQEAIRIDFVARTGGRSLRGSGEIDCSTGTFRAETIELFSGTNLRGERINGEGPDQVGRVPRAGSAPAMAAAQVCGGADLATLGSTTRREAPSPPTELAPARPAPVAEAPPPAPPPSLPAPAPAPVRRAAAPPAAAPSPAVAEIMAQIGAFSTREAAERAWGRLAELFPDMMAGKTMRIDSVTVNGTPMFRSSIAGFATPADAEVMCTRLMASSETCFVRRGP